MRERSNSYNNLNIPPSADESRWKLDWLNLLYLLSPIALGYVYFKGKREKEDIQDKLNAEIAFRKSKQLDSFIQNDFIFGSTEVFKHEIEKIIIEEEHKAKLTLQELYMVQKAIKDFLHIRCSPLMPRIHRIEIEKQIHKTSSEKKLNYLNMQEGLDQIIQTDHAHCGGGYDGNGRLYRVWMQLWKERIEHNKQQTIQKRKNELYAEMKTKNK